MNIVSHRGHNHSYSVCSVSVALSLLLEDLKLLAYGLGCEVIVC